MNRLRYFSGRLLLVGVSFFGITLVCFALLHLLPGGPVEQYLASMRAAGGEATMGMASEAMSPAQIEAVRKAFGFDKPVLLRFKEWFWDNKLGMDATSYKYTNRTVWYLIRERFPVSLSFGIPAFVLTYLVCIPLGIAKALRNGKTFDLVSSVVVFVLYAIPAFAFGMVLKMLFCGTSDAFWSFFPIGGFRSAPEIWDQLGFWARVKDQFMHLVLPVSCYMIGNFAVMTLLMKNSLLEQISQDYVRTVLAKGASLRRAVWRHALRNALIPLATGIGGVLTVMFAGSVLIEMVFDIPGLGRLSLDAIESYDYMVFMGILSLQSLFGLLGRVLSDFCYVLIDPRIHFGGET